tara:strand:- start:149 stop:682 length:534 start_codon:yes stop_codon:yes gene_type:complete
MLRRRVANINFKIRVKDETINSDNPYRWDVLTSFDIFEEKKILLFSLPGAFTPTCSTFQLPNFEKLYLEFKEKLNIKDIYCISVNDAFVMNAWAKNKEIKNIKMIPDGNGDFTRLMGMLVKKNNLGFGFRSWRYACVVQNWEIINWYEEPGIDDNCDDDPYSVTNPKYILNDLLNAN